MSSPGPRPIASCSTARRGKNSIAEIRSSSSRRQTTSKASALWSSSLRWNKDRPTPRWRKIVGARAMPSCRARPHGLCPGRRAAHRVFPCSAEVGRVKPAATPQPSMPWSWKTSLLPAGGAGRPGDRGRDPDQHRADHHPLRAVCRESAIWPNLERRSSYGWMKASCGNRRFRSSTSSA